MAGRECHVLNVGHVPGRNDQAARVGVAFDLVDDLCNLVNVLSIRGGPRAPLHAINRAELAVLASPLVPDRHASLLQPAHVGVSPQKPQKLHKNTARMEFFGCHQRETLRQVKAHLVTKNRPRTGARTVSLVDTMFVHMAHEGLVLVHVRLKR